MVVLLWFYLFYLPCTLSRLAFPEFDNSVDFFNKSFSGSCWQPRKIEDHIDIEDARKAFEEAGENISADEFWKELGI